MNTIVACVYRSGGPVYTREWVHALKRALDVHLPYARFRVLTDDAGVSSLWRIPMLHAWEGWWSKLELFRPGVFDAGARVLYLDLDTLPVGNLHDIAAYDGAFAMLTDFYHPRMAASGVMAWRVGEGEEELYHRFHREHRKPRGGRSDPFYNAVLGRVVRLQDAFPGQIVSLKVHARSGPPAGARLVCGHGRPRFSDRAAGWAHDAWRRSIAA